MRIFRLLREKSGWLVVYSTAFALINLAGLSEAIADEHWFTAAFYALCVAGAAAFAVTEFLNWRHYGRLDKKYEVLVGIDATTDREETT